MSESNWTHAVNLASRRQAFEKAHREVLDHISRGNADAAYYLVRLLCGLALVNDGPPNQ